MFIALQVEFEHLSGVKENIFMVESGHVARGRGFRGVI